jgi:uncharacterized protein
VLRAIAAGRTRHGEIEQAVRAEPRRVLDRLIELRLVERLVPQVLTVLMKELDDHMGERWEAAFREHLVRLAAAGELGEDIVDIGRWWRDSPPVEIDAVALAGRRREAVLVGEAKWARRVDAERVRRELERKAEALPRVRSVLRHAVCARERVERADDVLAVTAREIFGG